MAAHIDTVGHAEPSFDGGEQHVFDSMITPLDPESEEGPEACTTQAPRGFSSLLEWVESIKRYCFHNELGLDGLPPQNVTHDGWGWIVKVGELPADDPQELSAPTFSTSVLDNSIRVDVALPDGTLWFDVAYHRTDPDPLVDALEEVFVERGIVGSVVTLHNLDYGETYRIQVYALNTRASSISDVKNVPIPVPACGSPVSLRSTRALSANTFCTAVLDTAPTVTNPTWNSLTLDWTVATGATAYEVKHTQRVDCNDETESYEEPNPRTAISHIFPNLIPDAAYRLCVRTLREVFDPVAMESFEIRSDWIGATDRTSALPAPTNLTVLDVTDSGATLHWQNADGDIDDFVVQLDGVDVDASAGDVESYPFESVHRFTPNTDHRLGVASVHKNVRSMLAELILLVPPTLEDPVLSESSITLRWARDGRATKYGTARVAATASCTDATSVHEVTEGLPPLMERFERTFTIPGSERGSAHRLCVRATNAQGSSAWASIEAQTLAQCELTLTAGTGGMATGGGSGDCGREVTITATPATHYEFTGWTGGVSGTTNPMMFRLNTDLSVTAGFTKKQCELTLTAGTGGMATGGGSGDCGREVTITATPEGALRVHGLDRRGQRDDQPDDVQTQHRSERHSGVHEEAVRADADGGYGRDGHGRGVQAIAGAR